MRNLLSRRDAGYCCLAGANCQMQYRVFFTSTTQLGMFDFIFFLLYDFRYVWKCQPLHHPEELCFLRSIDEKQSGLTHSVPQLRLNTDWLTNHNDFLFSLNVFLHTATTVRSARSSQVVQVLPDYNVVQ